MSMSKNLKNQQGSEYPDLSDRDQLMQIFDVLGIPTKEDYCFLPKKSDAYQYLKHNIKNKSGTRVDFRQKYPAASDEAIDLLNNLL